MIEDENTVNESPMAAAWRPTVEVLIEQSMAQLEFAYRRLVDEVRTNLHLTARNRALDNRIGALEARLGTFAQRLRALDQEVSGDL